VVDVDSLACLRTLLDRPSAAVLMTYRNDGTAASSPVWFRVADRELQVVIAEGDVKLKHLAARPTCSLLVFETVPPFRGLRAEGEPTLRRDGVREARLAIASRYLGPEDGQRFTEVRGRGVILSMPLSEARSWDLSAILP
jgi:hypothetical protein